MARETMADLRTRVEDLEERLAEAQTDAERLEFESNDWQSTWARCEHERAALEVERDWLRALVDRLTWTDAEVDR